MVIKVHLIKPKSKYTPTFYKTSQIKFQSLSIPQQSRFRTRSTQKIIRHTNPWELMTNQEINGLAQRLQDKPQQLYEVVKQNQRQKSLQYEQARRLKFNKIQFNSPQHSMNQHHQFSNKKPYLNIGNNKKSKLSRYFSQTSLLNNININEDQHHNRILSKINMKKLQYEKEMKSLIQNKRLVLETDLPKISKIRIFQQPKVNLKLYSMEKSGKLPVWKMR